MRNIFAFRVILWSQLTGMVVCQSGSTQEQAFIADFLSRRVSGR